MTTLQETYPALFENLLDNLHPLALMIWREVDTPDEEDTEEGEPRYTLGMTLMGEFRGSWSRLAFGLHNPWTGPLRLGAIGEDAANLTLKADRTLDILCWFFKGCDDGNVHPEYIIGDPSNLPTRRLRVRDDLAIQGRLSYGYLIAIGHMLNLSMLETVEALNSELHASRGERPSHLNGEAR